MGRSNAIVVGAVVLGPLILGLEGYATYRSHHRQRATEIAETPAAASPEAQDQPAPAPAGPAPQIEPCARNDPPPAGVAAVEAIQDPTFQQRERFVLEHRRQVIQTADEQIFDVLNLPDAQRAAIRAIDDQFGRALETGSDPNAEQTRRAAIANLLGPDASPRFAFAEHKAERRARGQLRTELVRGE